MAKFKIIEYAKESYDELLHKVSWPTWTDLQSSAIVVSIASLIIALVVYLMDISFSSLLKGFYSWF
jgi:preprotein translocase subunit SecE